jgi:hypothetical protein
VEKTIEESKLVRGFSFEPAESGRADYRLRLGFEVRQDAITDPEAIWTVTTVMLFTAYPATCNMHRYTLIADLEDLAGNRMKTYVLHRSKRDFVWLLQAPNCGADPTDATVYRVAGSMLASLYRKIRRDSLLTLQDTALWSQRAEPLVYVSASRGHDIVEMATRAASPFPRYTFDSTQAERADFRIQFDLSIHGGYPDSLASVFGRGMLGIMTLGAVSLCPPTEIRLIARILDAGQEDLKSYALSRKVRTDALLRHEHGQCKPHDEHTRAEVVDALVRKLYRQIAKDGVVGVTPPARTSGEGGTAGSASAPVLLAPSGDTLIQARLGRAGGEKFGQHLSGVRALHRGDMLRGALRHHAPSAFSALRPEIDDPVGVGPDVEIVLDHHHGVAGIHQPVQHADQLLHVRHVQSDRGLVEDIKRLAGVRREA